MVTQAVTITRREAQEAEAKMLYLGILHSVTTAANSKKPLGRGFKKLFMKHFFKDLSNLRLALDEIGETVMVGVRVEFKPKEK